MGLRTTFEVLLPSFGFDADRSLAEIAALVHYLDLGGVAVLGAAGFTAILAGARSPLPDDDGLLNAMSAVPDDLYAAYADPSLTNQPGRKP
ncbi:chromate resistance protein ChrB domain-containing protein [Tahibacter sp.]|uniref:chromate resistance protein ChrB domain-containing protein n=1 Tax=Tahibacter sp. TaxID=2056211 RepID=UPI0028C4431E|nr:chromate resistance protein ChrB domain-containing protein [Tahibacter sp.]